MGDQHHNTMAGVQLPRRSGKIQEKTIQRNRSSLEILMQMGFLKHRAYVDCSHRIFRKHFYLENLLFYFIMPEKISHSSKVVN